MRTNQLRYKHKKTGSDETIKQFDLEKVDWGFNFKVSNELDAYRAAYLYRNSVHGVKVEFAEGLQMWLVTVFNATAKSAGIDGAK